MGREATLNRTDTAERVAECVSIVNAVSAQVDVLTESHNGLATSAGGQLTELKKRVDGASAWCEENEKAIAALETRRRKELETRHKVAMDAVYRAETRGLVTMEQLVVSLERMNDAFDAFATLTFWQRFRWLLTGNWTIPPNQTMARATSFMDLRHDIQMKAVRAA